MTKSIRSFIGAREYQTSRKFYQALGFEEVVIDPKMSYFRVTETLGFYLQDYYVKDWVDNSMLFLEVDDLEEWLEKIRTLDLPSKFKGVRLSGIHINDWGNEFFLHDPSGILWHIGTFKK